MRFTLNLGQYKVLKPAVEVARSTILSWNRFKEVGNVGRRLCSDRSPSTISVVIMEYLLLTVLQRKTCNVTQLLGQFLWQNDGGCQVKQSEISFTKVVSPHVGQ
ncbi:hypothetical protein TNCV_3390971 [Trichonephila clavipes]|nr:hypothetical protein TNCV_3390971 [Trichonephila clavipes]